MLRAHETQVTRGLHTFEAYFTEKTRPIGDSRGHSTAEEQETYLKRHEW